MNNQLESLNSLSDKRPILSSFVLLFMAIIAIGLAPIFMKLSEGEISPNGTIFNRLWISSLVFGVWNGLSVINQRLSNNQQADEQNPYTIQILGLLLLMGSFFAGKQLLWAWSLTQTSVVNSTIILHALIPLLTAVGGWILFGRRPDRQFFLGMSMAIAGATLIGIHDLWDSINKLQGDIFSVMSAILSAGYLLIMEQLLSKFATKTLLLWCSTIGTVLTMTVLVVTLDNFFPMSWKGWFSVISLALVCQVIGQGLIAYALNQLSSGVVAVTMLLDPILSGFFAWAILSEKLSILNGISCCIVLLGIYLALSSPYAVKLID
ncbi:MAG: DMT family transporter [Oscillatoriales cyanobacterium]|nr:MAG: DMT family transporter [Oscillatoriales cyanobacterium]TAH23943.1 MAG: DMT family transporter [Oscillatoriales cyanobacterium]